MQKLFYMQTWCYYYADNWKSYCFVLTVSMILFYAGISTFFSTPKIGLSVTIGQALVSWCFRCKGFWGKFTAGQRAADHLCIIEVSHLPQSIPWICGFGFLNIGCRGGWKKHWYGFFTVKWHKRDVFWGQDKCTVFSASVGLGDALCLLPQFRSQLYPMVFKVFWKTLWSFILCSAIIFLCLINISFCHLQKL